MRHTPSALLALTLLAACAQPVSSPGAAVDPPAALRNTVSDPTRSAIVFTNAVFSDPAQMAGRPVQVGSAIAQYEWLASSLPADPRWIGASPNVEQALRFGRDDLRAAFGVAPGTPPQLAVAAFDRAAAALSAGDRGGAEAALVPVAGAAGAPRAVQLLSALPPVPRAAAGARLAQDEMSRLDSQSGNNRGRR